jgi:hypothetical protein
MLDLNGRVRLGLRKFKILLMAYIFSGSCIPSIEACSFDWHYCTYTGKDSSKKIYIPFLRRKAATSRFQFLATS